jgi:hypothetical protein
MSGPVSFAQARISIPRGRSSVGRASASQAEGRGFEPHRPLPLKPRLEPPRVGGNPVRGREPCNGEPTRLRLFPRLDGEHIHVETHRSTDCSANSRRTTENACLAERPFHLNCTLLPMIGAQVGITGDPFGSRG